MYPPTNKPNVRTDRTKANEIDIYGYRPLQHPWRLLSPYEFLRSWYAEPLLVPTYYENKGVEPRTQWTAQGLQLIKSKEYQEGNAAAKPGVHYTVLASAQNEYITFPELPSEVYQYFRHAWIILRKKRPDVIVIEGLKQPSSSRTDTENAKYCSLFFRPWTLLSGDPKVPHLSLLGCSRSVLGQLYTSKEEPPLKSARRSHSMLSGLDSKDERIVSHVQWHKAWEEYVRGNVVSQTAASLS